jgi:hypothetical protein
LEFFVRGLPIVGAGEESNPSVARHVRLTLNDFCQIYNFKQFLKKFNMYENQKNI